MRVLALSIALALVAGPALSNETTAATAKDEDKERIVCREQMKANSRFTTRLCLTKAEWEFRAEQHRKAFEEVQNRPVINGARGN